MRILVELKIQETVYGLEWLLSQLSTRWSLKLPGLISLIQPPITTVTMDDFKNGA